MMLAWSIPGLRRRLVDLWRLQAGSTIIEFAVAAPVLLMLLMGIFDAGYTVYGQAVLNGAIQQAARSSSLETADTSTADAYITSIMKGVLPTAQVTTSRKSYYDFTDIARPEAWNDGNNNGTCDNSETYTDENGNGQWDADVGKSGNGGANDVVVYTVTVKYTPIFTNPFIDGTSSTRTLTASTVTKNQPFSAQTAYGSSAGVCS